MLPTAYPRSRTTSFRCATKVWRSTHDSFALKLWRTTRWNQRSSCDGNWEVGARRRTACLELGTSSSRSGVRPWLSYVVGRQTTRRTMIVRSHLRPVHFGADHLASQVMKAARQLVSPTNDTTSPSVPPLWSVTEELIDPFFAAGEQR